jgi:hypothetical protein
MAIVVHNESFMSGVQQSTEVFKAAKRFVSFVTVPGDTYAVGDWVSLDYTVTGEEMACTVKLCPTGKLAFGVVAALPSQVDVDGNAAANSVVSVQISGYCPVAKVETGINAGDLLSVITTDGVAGIPAIPVAEDPPVAVPYVFVNGMATSDEVDGFSAALLVGWFSN